jgi:PPM family protein phosphatase
MTAENPSLLGISTKVSYSASSDPGFGLTENQDAYAVFETPYFRLFLLADGLGAPDVGREIAIRALSEIQRELSSERNLTVERITKLLNDLNKKLRTIFLSEFEKQKTQPPTSDIFNIATNAVTTGVTLVGIVFTAQEIIKFNVGNSRLYHLSGEAIEQLSIDHTIEGRLRRSRMSDKPLAGGSRPMAHLVTSILGIKKDLEIDVGVITKPVNKGDIFLLCSDGLYDVMNEADMLQQSKEIDNFKNLARRLVERAKNRESTDNITCVALKVEEIAEPNVELQAIKNRAIASSLISANPTEQPSPFLSLDSEDSKPTKSTGAKVIDISKAKKSSRKNKIKLNLKKTRSKIEKLFFNVKSKGDHAEIFRRRSTRIKKNLIKEVKKSSLKEVKNLNLATSGGDSGVENPPATRVSEGNRAPAKGTPENEEKSDSSALIAKKDLTQANGHTVGKTAEGQNRTVPPRSVRPVSRPKQKEKRSLFAALSPVKSNSPTYRVTSNIVLGVLLGAVLGTLVLSMFSFDGSSWGLFDYQPVEEDLDLHLISEYRKSRVADLNLKAPSLTASETKRLLALTSQVKESDSYYAPEASLIRTSEAEATLEFDQIRDKATRRMMVDFYAAVRQIVIAEQNRLSQLEDISEELNIGVTKLAVQLNKLEKELIQQKNLKKESN